MGKYLVEVHKCSTPKIREQDNEGTIWQCDCGIAFEVHYSGLVPYGSSYWGWSIVDYRRFRKDGSIMSRSEWSVQQLTQFAVTPKKRWWQR